MRDKVESVLDKVGCEYFALLYRELGEVPCKDPHGRVLELGFHHFLLFRVKDFSDVQLHIGNELCAELGFQKESCFFFLTSMII